MSLAEQVAERAWYHTIELPEGIVTPGYFDTPAGLQRVPMPASLEGKRCLDIACANGFWAFEMERRGAAEVIALDLPNAEALDWPGAGNPPQVDHVEEPRRCFEVAREALGSSVERLDLSVYDITPERLGTFDFVFIGNVLLHLRDPVGALKAARSVVGGELLSVDVVSLVATIKSPRQPMATLSDRPLPWWWTPNRAGYRNYFTRAGFDLVDTGGIFFFPFGDGYERRPPMREVLRSASGLWFWTVLRRFGAPTSWVLARPGGR
jgi:tRNA (mo5U34)-methyltransferase